jgi:hypothetical protein
MRLFFDRNMSVYLARMIDIYEREHTIVRHDEDGRFGPRTPDIEWIKALASDYPPWAVLSADGRILKNKVEKAALEEARLTFFCLTKTWANGMNFHEYTWKFIKIWPKILEKAKHPTPKIYEVSDSKVDLIRIYS